MAVSNNLKDSKFLHISDNELSTMCAPLLNIKCRSAKHLLCFKFFAVSLSIEPALLFSCVHGFFFFLSVPIVAPRYLT